MDFNIRPISKICAETGEELEPASLCWSVLLESEGKLVRQDYSLAAWDGPPQDSIGYWQCVVPEESSAKPQLADPDSLFQYFVQLSESPNHVEQDYQYVLALLLLRKKRLILEESFEYDDKPAMRLIGTGGEGPFEVVERDLTDDQVQQLQDQLFGRSEEAA